MKHIVDSDHRGDAPMRTMRYVAQERREGRHANTMALHRRARPMKETLVQKYLRIDRGSEA